MRLNATLTKDRPEYPEELRTFEERRIDWTDGEIHKAIIIKPCFELTGVNSAFWSFVNVARPVARPFDMRTWQRYLLKDVDFEEIDRNIDELLQKSEESLALITSENLTDPYENY